MYCTKYDLVIGYRTILTANSLQEHKLITETVKVIGSRTTPTANSLQEHKIIQKQ